MMIKKILCLTLFAFLSKTLIGAAASDAPAGGGAGLPIPTTAKDCCLFLKRWEGKTVEVPDKGITIELENVSYPVLASEDPCNTVNIKFKIWKDEDEKAAVATIAFLPSGKVKRSIFVDHKSSFHGDTQEVVVDKNFWFNFCFAAGLLAIEPLYPSEKLNLKDQEFLKQLGTDSGIDWNQPLLYEDNSFQVLSCKYTEDGYSDSFCRVTVQYGEAKQNARFQIAIEDDKNVEGVLVKFFIISKGLSIPMGDSRYKIDGKTQSDFVDDIFSCLCTIIKESQRI